QDTFNLLDYLPLEGFVFSASPNNFIAINGNLCTAPLIMGDVVIAKPSSDVVYSFHIFLKILHEAGLPADVLSVLHGNSKMIGDILLEHPMLSGIHFTGGTETFSEMWRRVGQNVDKYRNFPVLVGETGGKDPIVVYDDSDPLQIAIAMAVGGFGAQGRKCSSTSRVYMTPEMFAKVEPHLTTFLRTIKVGDVADVTNYLGAIINEREYEKVNSYINQAYHDFDKGVRKILRGTIPGTQGWFIAPTIIVTDNPHYRTISEEVFGPVITICLLPKDRFEKEVLTLCDSTSPYALTGAIHTQDVLQFCEALHELRFAAGNIYDDRTTAAMVNQQPFSGMRKSGTDSKVGWSQNLRNWTKPRTICLRSVKTTFPPKYLEE
ncbi:MAG: aldehyde dehydrogenase family protein, partial [Candidatus Spechtbacteria bacterium]|nr:aldehyde dehydrogenase family protein [Candidatus Spechtbacteria bacterium]